MPQFVSSGLAWGGRQNSRREVVARVHVRAFLAEFGPVIERWESNHTVALA
ncbi:hypothetical protein RE0356_38790 [Prescottella equi]|nr:hypothetical protein RE0356_38790 [Prescottella equi]